VLGGLCGLVTVRSILGNIRVLVLPDQFAIGKAHEAFTPDGQLKDPAQKETVARIAAPLVEVVGRGHP
jgi:chromate reductase